MKKTFVILNFINVVFTIINVSLAISYKYQMKKLYANTEEDSTLQYLYLYEMLCNPYYILQMTALAFDIGYYILLLLFTYVFCADTNDENADNVRAKAMKENRMSNMLVEFLFLVLIKGIAYGFGFFYAIEGVWEAKRIIEDVTNVQTKVQLSILNNILKIVSYIKWVNLITMVYILWMYIIRFAKECRKKNKRIKKTKNEALLNDTTTNTDSLN